MDLLFLFFILLVSIICLSYFRYKNNQMIKKIEKMKQEYIRDLETQEENLNKKMRKELKELNDVWSKEYSDLLKRK